MPTTRTSAMNGAAIDVKTAKNIYNVTQAVILVVFIAFVVSLFMSNGPSSPSSSSTSVVDVSSSSIKLPMTESCSQPGCIEQLAEEKLCYSSRSWMILPMAFLTGGLLNIEGFASSASVLL
eukprot:TRINITY_DN2399_c0_g2_i1.p1 TRINITY_DN2399_c0_g2~~TRINITY_DN2399_c0_g2_i1.p1  ORF type:complete len:121 (-),score=25.38 TRINITY_DN2399_c0_g2_i1:570-932(-)